MSASADDIRAKAAQDPTSCYERVGLPPGTLRRVGKVLQTRCPFHRDNTPSFTVFPDGGWHCFGCGAGGSLIDFVMRRQGIGEFAQACDVTARLLGLDDISRPRRPPRPLRSLQPPAPARPDPPPIPHALARGYHQALLEAPGALRWLERHKALPLDAVRIFCLGVDLTRRFFTIPIPRPGDHLLPDWADVRRYMPKHKPKFLPWLDANQVPGRGDPRLFGWPFVSDEPVIVWVEGELDAMNLLIRNVPAVSATNGVNGALADSLQLPDFTGRTIRILADADEAGDRMRELLPPRLYGAGADKVTVLRWPDRLPDGSPVPDGFDVSDYLAWTGGDLRGLGL